MLRKTAEGYLYEEFIYCYCKCGKTRSKYNKYGHIVKYIEDHHKIVKRGKDSHMYKNGRVECSNGYIVLLKHGYHSADKYGYVLEHRYVYEQYYNCCLLSIADIHHKDGSRSNNNIKNLEPIWHWTHTSLHHKHRK